MKLTLQAHRATLKTTGGTRYVSFTVTDPPPAPLQDTIFVLDCSAPLATAEGVMRTLIERLAAQFPSAPWLLFAEAVQTPGPAPTSLAFEPGSAWREAWLRGCHAISHDTPRGGHCVLLTDGHPTVGDTDPERLSALAAAVWENTGIATSVMAIGSRPNRGFLRAFAWQGGGSFCRVKEPEDAVVIPPLPRLVLDIEPPFGRILSPVRRVDQAQCLSVVVNGLRHLEAEFSFNAGQHPLVKARLRTTETEGPWESLEFTSGRGGPRDAHVMRRVATALARRAPHGTTEPAPARDRTATAEGGASLVGRFIPPRASWPEALASDAAPELVRDLVRGCLLWGAAGSALGRGLSGLDPATIRARYGPAGVEEYQAFIPGFPDSAGMVSGDVQMLGIACSCLLASGGNFDPEDFGKRLVALLPRNRGIGSAAESAALALMDGTPWYRAGLVSNSGGNGAALRVAPVGLVWALYPNLIALYRNAVVSAVVTHTHPIGVAGAVVMAAAVAWCIRRRVAGEPMDAVALLIFLADLVSTIEDSDAVDRRSGIHTRMSTRLREVPELLHQTPEEALAVTWNGAFALESVPAALYCFLRHPDEPRQAVAVAVNAGFDSDSVGSMTGHLAGAWCGLQRMLAEAPTWWSGLEWRDGLHDLGDRLADLCLARMTGETSVHKTS